MRTKPNNPFSFQIKKHLKNYLMSGLLAIALSVVFWTQHSVQEIRSPGNETAVELYANQIHDDLTSTYTAAIGSAKESIVLVVYSLTDPQIISSLRKKSMEGVTVRVTCDAKASPYIDSKLGPKIITVRRFGPGLMHQKMLVIDGKQTWIGSANMTTESLRMHGNLIASIDDEPFAQAITNKAQTLKVEGHNKPFPHQNFLIGGQQLELWFLPDNSGAIARLKEMIRSAKKTIRVAMFTWTRQDLAYEIIKASRKGVDAEIVIDHYSGKGASIKIVKLLKESGISVALSRGGPLLHHKFLYIDGKELVNGSANWTKAAFTANDDCFFILHDLTKEQHAHMEALWKTIKEDSILEK